MKEQKLTELNPRWVDSKPGVHVGMTFSCPTCPPGYHSLNIDWNNPSPYKNNQVYTKSGESFEDLTIKQDIGSPKPGCKFRGKIKQGVVSWH